MKIKSGKNKARKALATANKPEVNEVKEPMTLAAAAGELKLGQTNRSVSVIVPTADEPTEVPEPTPAETTEVAQPTEEPQAPEEAAAETSVEPQTEETSAPEEPVTTDAPAKEPEPVEPPKPVMLAKPVKKVEKVAVSRTDLFPGHIVRARVRPFKLV